MNEGWDKPRPGNGEGGERQDHGAHKEHAFSPCSPDTEAEAPKNEEDHRHPEDGPPKPDDRDQEEPPEETPPDAADRGDREDFSRRAAGRSGGVRVEADGGWRHHAEEGAREGEEEDARDKRSPGEWEREPDERHDEGHEHRDEESPDTCTRNGPEEDSARRGAFHEHSADPVAEGQTPEDDGKDAREDIDGVAEVRREESGRGDLEEECRRTGNGDDTEEHWAVHGRGA